MFEVMYPAEKARPLDGDLPIHKSLSSFLAVVCNLKTNAIRVGKENCVIIWRVLRVKLRNRKFDFLFGKQFGNGVHSGTIFNSEAKVVQTGSQRIMFGIKTVSRPPGPKPKWRL